MNSDQMTKAVLEAGLRDVDKTYFLGYLQKWKAQEEALGLIDEGKSEEAKYQLKILATSFGKEFVEMTDHIFSHGKPKFLEDENFVNPFDELVFVKKD